MKPAFALAALVLLLIAACHRTKQCSSLSCPAFPEAYRTLLPTDSGQVLLFTDGTRDIAFQTTQSRMSPSTQTVPYTVSEDEECGDPVPCMLQSDWAGEASATTDHPAIQFSYQASFNPSLEHYSGTTNAVALHWLPSGPPAYFRFDPALGDSAHGDRVVLNARIGPKTYDRVVVLTTDTVAPAPTIWRVYFSNPGGIVSFEDRRTRSLYWRR